MHLLAVRRDGTVIEIGTVTSDLGGFRYEWTPPDADLYTITAHFAGDNSYGSSWAATGLSVGPSLEKSYKPTVTQDYCLKLGEKIK